MYEKVFKLEIVTPNKVIYQGDATSLTAPGTQGGFQILYDHAAFLSSIETGELKVKDREGKDTSFATSGGFVEAKKNHVVVLAETAERCDEIDVERARSAKARAEKRVHGKGDDIDIERARAALRRATNRLHLAQRR